MRRAGFCSLICTIYLPALKPVKPHKVSNPGSPHGRMLHVSNLYIIKYIVLLSYLLIFDYSLNYFIGKSLKIFI
jgi:hypothetical protein